MYNQSFGKTPIFLGLPGYFSCKIDFTIGRVKWSLKKAICNFMQLYGFIRIFILQFLV